MIRYHAQWVVPVTSPPLRDGTVAVEGTRIAYVGPRIDAPAGEDVELGEAILCPGLVNAHCHLELTAMRGFLEGLPFRDWIVRLTSAKRSVLTREDLLDSARLGVVEGLRAGVSTYADTCDSGVAFDAMLEAGVRGIMYQEVFGPDPAQCERSMGELRDKIAALRPRISDLVTVGVSPHAPYTVSDALFEAVARYAAAEGLPVAVHIAESEAESDLVERAGGVFAEGLRTRGIAVAPRARSPIALLARAGLLRGDSLLIHAVRVTPDDLSQIKAGRAAVAHCPVSNAKLGHGIAPLVAFLEHGVPVGLGSDSVASNNRMDLLTEAHAAVLLQRAASGRPDAVSASDALALATIGGARALGLADRIGSLEVGKEADLAAFTAGAPARLPLHSPEDALVHVLSGSDAVLCVVAGRVLMRDGAVLGADPALPRRVQDAADRLQVWHAEVEAIGGPVPPASATR